MQEPNEPIQHYEVGCKFWIKGTNDFTLVFSFFFFFTISFDIVFSPILITQKKIKIHIP